MEFGSGWKTYVGLAVAGLSFVLGDFGVATPEFATWGEFMGALFAAFGIRHKMG